ncbi:hypothetical protein [Vitreimonas sp.]|uniref:hypothetical protein n=1 Tax=Vitreimonas sp. TaxID=3069702 RepID=UPI002D795E84|nr:hypothetical protein [Vitreimonas sp.]
MITLKQAYEQGSLRVAFYCVRPGACAHVGKVDIREAIRRWGEERRLNEIPARCGRCGSRDHVSVRCEPPGRLGKRGRR